MQENIGFTRAKYISYAIIAAVFIGVTAYSLINQSAINNRFAFSGEGGIILSDSQGGVTEISFADITSVALVDAPDYGEPVAGNTVNGVQEGLWQSDMFGEYIASVSKKITNCVVIRTNEATYVINFESNTATSAIYEAITKEMKQGAES